MEVILRYFDLRLGHPQGELRGDGAKKRSWYAKFFSFLNNIFIYHFLIYSAVVLGVLGQALFMSYTDNANQSAPSLIIGCIVAAVIFPKVSKEIGIDPENPHPMQFFLAFQGGFFWQTIIGQLGKSIP